MLALGEKVDHEETGVLLDLEVRRVLRAPSVLLVPADRLVPRAHRAK